MKKKTNPLYVVKGKNVEAVSGWFDLLVKKFNLTPIVEMLQTLFKEILKGVQSYAMFVVVKKTIDEIMEKLTAFVEKYGLA